MARAEGEDGNLGDIVREQKTVGVTRAEEVHGDFK